MLIILIFAIFCEVVTNALSNFSQADVKYWNEIAKSSIDRKMSLTHHPRWEKAPKNVILFVGAGLGVSTVTAARVARAQRKNLENLNSKFTFEEFPHSGLVMTSSYNRHTTDSAAAAMALFTGWKVENGYLGVKPGMANGSCTDDNARISDGIADMALQRKMAVGFVTTASITGATPASLYAKNVHHRREQVKARDGQCADIGSQLLQHPANKFKVLMGGGQHVLLPKRAGGIRADGLDLFNEWSKLPGKRNHLLDLNQFDRYVASDDDHVLGVFYKDDTHYTNKVRIDGKKRMRSVPRLVDMVNKALDVLFRQSEDNNGFFLVVEAGQIDRYLRRNLLNRTVYEVNELDVAVRAAMEQARSDNETLVIVTADHAHALAIPGEVPKNTSIFDALSFNYRGRNSGEDVGIWAYGPFSWLFSGTMENTEVAYKIKYLLCLYEKDSGEKNICDEPREYVMRSTMYKPDMWNVMLYCVTGVSLLATCILAGLLYNKQEDEEIENELNNGNTY